MHWQILSDGDGVLDAGGGGGIAELPDEVLDGIGTVGLRGGAGEGVWGS